MENNQKIDWEFAYKELESQIEFMMLETKELLENNPATLRINNVKVDQNPPYTGLIVNATGDNMRYACYLYNAKNNKELKKVMYQLSNTFIFDLPIGQYKAKIFVKEMNKNQRKTSMDINFKVKKA
ncbi:hypothetical protein [Abyssicoccus albus]|uniref:hypothetical protein n=1 Tax=Abyssicoccus albus TaxID=1817405 RepID=UPI00097E178D|nr:hypothetical protein [Abyssicoccus albus]AQL55884.1 hypothetical protein BVH56_02605 [Abyssicoccus albus]